MKQMKWLVASVLVLSLFVGCLETLTELTEEELIKEGIIRDTIQLWNPLGAGMSGLDAVLGEGVAAASVSGSEIYYTAADSLRVDFKASTIITRASDLQPEITSCNGTMFEAIDSAEYTDVRVRKLQDLADDAIADNTATESINFTASPYFVAKLGGGRGYVLAKAMLNSLDSQSSFDNDGSITVEYWLIQE